MSRMLYVTVHSARDLRNADEDEGGQSDPYVIVCFDNNPSQELGRTLTVPNCENPSWEYELEVDVAKHVRTAVEDEGLPEPKMITFCVYDADESDAEPLGVAGIAFAELVKRGSIKERELPVFLGQGSVTVSLKLKKVKKSSMLTNDGLLKIGGGVVGAAALGASAAYLFNRYQKKKERLQDTEAEGEVEEDAPRTGLAYGYNEDSDDDDEENKGDIKKWWEMEDENDDDDDEERWGDAE